MTFVVAHLWRDPSGSGHYDSLELYRFPGETEATAFADELERNEGWGRGYPGPVSIVDTESDRGWDDPEEKYQLWRDLDESAESDGAEVE
jgi:hypothetical protein